MTSKRILLVDDEPSIRVVLSAVLERAGYLVDLAEDGFSALRRMQEALPDVVITDLRMPNMNGFELLSVIRRRFPDIPTIVISGEFLACQIHQGRPLADAVFQKGHYSIPEFLTKISDLIEVPIGQPAKAQSSPMWTSTGSSNGNSAVMLTCIECLRSFPIDPCAESSQYPKKTTCFFCGAKLEVQLVAVGMAQAGAGD